MFKICNAYFFVHMKFSFFLGPPTVYRFVAKIPSSRFCARYTKNTYTVDLSNTCGDS